MELGSYAWIVEILMDFNRRCPLEVGFHAPYQGYRASNLHQSRHFYPWQSIVLDEDVLGFSEVSGIAFSVEASRHESSTWATAILPWDQDEVYLGAIDVGWTYKYIAKDAWYLERSIFDALKFTKQVVIESELGYVIDAIWKIGSHQKLILLGNTDIGSIMAKCLSLISDFCKRSLNILGKVHIIGKVECSLTLNLLYHIYISLILLITKHTCRIRQRNEH